MISLINLLSKIVGIKRDIWHDTEKKLPKKGRPLVWENKYEPMCLNQRVYVGGYFNGKYFCWGDFKFHPATIRQWAYKTDAEKTGGLKADKTK